MTKWNGQPIPVPAGVAPPSAADGHLTVVSADRRTEWEFWRASGAGPGGYRRGRGPVGPDRSGVSAPRRQLCARIRHAVDRDHLRADEARDGINHALGITVPSVSSDYVYPARQPLRRQRRANAIKYGMLFVLRPNYPVPAARGPALAGRMSAPVKSKLVWLRPACAPELRVGEVGVHLEVGALVDHVGAVGLERLDHVAHADARAGRDRIVGPQHEEHPVLDRAAADVAVGVGGRRVDESLATDVRHGDAERMVDAVSASSARSVVEISGVPEPRAELSSRLVRVAGAGEVELDDDRGRVAGRAGGGAAPHLPGGAAVGRDHREVAVGARGGGDAGGHRDRLAVPADHALGRPAGMSRSRARRGRPARRKDRARVGRVVGRARELHLLAEPGNWSAYGLLGAMDCGAAGTFQGLAVAKARQGARMGGGGGREREAVSAISVTAQAAGSHDANPGVLGGRNIRSGLAARTAGQGRATSAG